MPPVGSHLPPALGVSRQVKDRFHEGFTVLRFDKNAGAGVFDNLAGLPVDRDNHRPLARHVFEEFGGNHRLEQFGLSSA